MSEVYKENGVIGGFIGHIQYTFINKPDGYDANKIEEMINNTEVEKCDLKETENIIVIMDESFADFNMINSDVLKDEMIPFINSLSDNTIKGNLYVPVFGSGTCDTEFEALLSASTLYTTQTPFQTSIYSPTESLISFLNDRGDYTQAFHPYEARNWNRDKVYENLGFNECIFINNYVKSGLLERSRQGVYILSDSVHDDMYTLMLRSERIIFSHDTALFLNGLSERTPFTHSVTIPSNSSLPNSLIDECQCYYIKPELHQVGAVNKKNTLGNEVRCYNAERTICDLLRSRSRIDEEIVISAIKNYAISPDKDLNLLSLYASQFCVGKVLKRYMEVLL